MTAPVSRATDENGSPLVVHHGSCRPPFATFDRMAGAMSRRLDTIDKVGIWFSTSMADAKRFAGSGPDAHVVSATVDVRNPLVVVGFEGLAEVGRRHGLERPDKANNPLMRHLPGEAFRKLLISLGHDGIHMIRGGAGDFRDSTADYWVVLDDSQISRMSSPGVEHDVAEEPASPTMGGPR